MKNKLTAAVAANVADEVALESFNRLGGILAGIALITDVGGIVDKFVELEILTGSFSIVFTGGFVELAIFSGGS